MATIKKEFHFENTFGKTENQKDDQFRVDVTILADKKTDVTDKWTIEVSSGMLGALFKKKLGTAVKIPRGKKQKISLTLTPKGPAAQVSYTAKVSLRRVVKGKASKFANKIDLPFTLLEAEMKGLSKIPEDIEDLRKIHSTHEFESDQFGYVSKFLFDTKALKFDELTDLKKRIDALYNSFSPKQKNEVEKYYTLVQKYYAMLADMVTHQDALKKKIEAEVGKWAFTHDKKGAPDGLEKKTWTDPTYLEQAKASLEHINKIRQRIVAFLQAADKIYKTVHKME